MIPTNPLDAESSSEFDFIFTTLTVEVMNRNTKEKRELRYDDLLKSKINGVHPKRLLVEGEGGAGKTTLCAKIAWDWAHENMFEEFEMVLVVPIWRAKNNSVGEVVKTYLSESNTTTPKQLDRYIMNNQSDVCLVLDGLDEMDSDFLQEDIAEIIQMNKFKSGVALVTSRSWKADTIRQNSALNRAYAFISVEGFSKENASKYINKFFAADQTSAEELIAFCGQCDVIAESIIQFPIYVSMICTMWRELGVARRETIHKLNTYSQLFKVLVDFLIDHSLDNTTHENPDEWLREQRERDNNQLMQLGRIAYNGLKDHQMVFPENVFDESRAAMETCCRVGVLTREKKAKPRLDRKEMDKPREIDSKVFFPHKLFQEYLAAMHLHSLYRSNPEDYEKLLNEDILPRAEEYRYLLYFASSLGNGITQDVLKHLFVRENNQLSDFIIDVAFESQNETGVKIINDCILSGSREIEINEDQSAHTVSAYFFMLEKLNQSLVTTNC